TAKAGRSYGAGGTSTSARATRTKPGNSPGRSGRMHHPTPRSWLSRPEWAGRSRPPDQSRIKPRGAPWRLPRQAGPMSLDGLSGLVNRIIAWADRMQREHGVLGFPYAVVKKYGDDEGGRQAALITYYGFLSIFPLLLLGVAVLSRVLTDHPNLRQRLITAIVPEALQSTVDHAVTTLPTSAIPYAAGLIGLRFSGTGVVFSAYQTLNHVAAVPYRLRACFFTRYIRVFVILALLLLGALAVGTLTVVATTLPSEPGVQRAAAVLGTGL